MYFYHKNSRDKIVHAKNCHYVGNVENVLVFKNLYDAHKAGYRLCKHCRAKVNFFLAEKEEINAICEKYEFFLKVRQLHIAITSDYDKWIIAPNSKNQIMEIYHKNKIDRTDTKATDYQGYHFQNVTYLTVAECLEYIHEHDVYREKHPFYIKPEPPKKGSRNYRKAQKKEKERGRKKAIWKTLCVIESLNTKTAARAV